MTTVPHIEAAIDQAYRLESLLRILSLAVDGEQITGSTFTFNGGRQIIDMAADMAGGWSLAWKMAKSPVKRPQHDLRVMHP